MRKLILVVALAAFQFCALATSPAQCTPVANITTAAAYLTASNWASCSGTYPCGTVGGAGSCAASGGFSVPYKGNASQAIPAGVPGAQLQFSITAASWATNTVTLTISPTATGTALAAGSWMTITGVVCSPASPCLYNQQWVKAATVSGTTVTFALTSNAGTYSSGGTLATSAGDYIHVRSGFTLHYPAGLGIELGRAISGVSDSTRIRGTSALSRGVEIIDQGGYLRTHAYSNSNGNFISVDQYGMFKVQPNGTLKLGEFINSPNLVVNGDFRAGCLDQVNFPDSTCAGNAGGWVYASVGSTLNLTATRSLISASYTASGSTLSATGSAGQWCKISFPNANGAAWGLLPLTGTNTVADGSMIWVQGAGFGFAAAPTTGTASSSTATCSGTVNVTASIATLPAGLSVGDIVTLTPVPQPFGVYPYTTDPVTGVTNPTLTSKTSPPPPPLMPQTNDTGGPTHTCGSLSTCLVPDGVKLGVVAISGDSVSLGWLQGGTTADPYWTGTETAMAITDAGSGWLWLSKPAFIEREMGAANWATSITKNWTTNQGSPMDAVRTSLAVQAGVSNAAGTGPGRPGDNSLTFSVVTSGGTITQANTTYQLYPWLVKQQGDVYVNYDNGIFTIFGENNQGHISTPSTESHTGVTYTIPNSSPKFFYVPTQQSNNSLVVGNSYIQGLFMDVSTSGAINFANLYNDGPVHSSWAAYQFNTSHYTNSEVGFGSINFSGLPFQPVNPMLVWGNAVYGSYKASNTASPHFVFGGAGTSTVSNVDISNNYFADFSYHVGSELVSDTTQTTFSGVTITNNSARTDNVLAGDPNGHGGAWWSNLLFQDNFVTASGNFDGSATAWPAYVFPIQTVNGTGINIQWNNIYGGFRCMNFGSGVSALYNSCLNNAHHGIATANPSATGTILNVHIASNLFASNINNQTINVLDMGYDKRAWINNMEIDHNTVTAPGNGSGGACWNYGDTDGNAMTLITGSKIHDNVCAPGSGGYVASITVQSANGYHSVVRDYTANNSIQGTNSPYQGNSPNGNNLVVAAYNCDVAVTNANGNYNADGTRNAKGLILQNPNNCSSTQSNTAFKYTYNSTTNRTVQWASDGVTYGAARQLNWDGTGTTSYTVGTGGVSAAKPNSTSFTLTLTASPFVVCGSAGSGNTSTSCPITRWALFLTKAGVTCTSNCAYAVVDVPATNKVTLTPCDSLSNPCTTITDADTFILLNPENTVFDSGGSNYVVYGITDAGALPTSTPSPDTGITISVNDYYHLSPFGEPVVTGVPTTWTLNVDGSPITPFYGIPALGVSAEKVLGSGFYIPTGTAWKTASSTGSYIGAIPPRTIPRHRSN